MPICTKCNEKWSWKQTIIKTMTFKSEMSCPYCAESQFHSKGTKVIIPVLSLIILLPFFIRTFFDVSTIISLSIIPILAVVSFAFYPFSIKLSSKEEFHF